MLERRLLWLVPLVFVTLAVLGVRRVRDQEAAARLDAITSELDAPAEGTATKQPLRAGTEVANRKLDVAPSALPASLAGTEIDGALHLDVSGHFAPDADAVRYFEYFLSALGELDQAGLRARILADMSTRLSPVALPEAARFLDDYLRYREEAGDLGRVTADPDDLHAAVDTLYALRREVFGDKLASKLFADDEALRTSALERRLIVADKSLSEGERAQRLSALDQDLPAELGRARAQAALPLAVHDEVAKLRAQGATDDAVRAVREKALGAEAADRLAALDRARADFARRLSEFRARRTAVESDSHKSAAEKESAVRSLFESTFALEERTRAQLLTR